MSDKVLKKYTEYYAPMVKNYVDTLLKDNKAEDYCHLPELFLLW